MRPAPSRVPPHLPPMEINLSRRCARVARPPKSTSVLTRARRGRIPRDVTRIPAEHRVCFQNRDTSEVVGTIADVQRIDAASVEAAEAAGVAAQAAAAADAAAAEAAKAAEIAEAEAALAVRRPPLPSSYGLPRSLHCGC